MSETEINYTSAKEIIYVRNMNRGMNNIIWNTILKEWAYLFPVQNRQHIRIYNINIKIITQSEN